MASSQIIWACFLYIEIEILKKIINAKDVLTHNKIVLIGGKSMSASANMQSIMTEEEDVSCFGCKCIHYWDGIFINFCFVGEYVHEPGDGDPLQ